MRTKVKSVAASAALLLALITGTLAHAQSVTDKEAREIARDAYVYAYPLVLDDVTMRQAQNHAEATGIITQGPYNQFTHSREFVPVDFKAVVRPNQDTLYSAAGLDLGPEPVVLSVPATDRYFMLPLMSLWSDIFAVPGTRTTGRNVAKDFLLVAPDWTGNVPAGLELIRSPTRRAFVIGRTQTNGPADYEAVHKVQAGYKLTPLSAWGKGTYIPPKGKVDPSIDMKTRPPVQVDRMDAAAYFGRFAELLKGNPAGPADYPMIHRLDRVGFKAGQPFDLQSAPVNIRKAFEQGAAEGHALVMSEGKKAAGIGVKGWAYSTRSGAYGVDYTYRAAIAQCCLGENLPQDAIYPAIASDSAGRQLDGGSKYVLHFAKGQLPPVDAFWSVTAYDKDGYFIPNKMNRQLLGSRDRLVTNADGSVDILIQADSPGKSKEANWLPVASRQPFNLLLRLYSPRGEIIDGTWVPPQVNRVR